MRLPRCACVAMAWKSIHVWGTLLKCLHNASQESNFTVLQFACWAPGGGQLYAPMSDSNITVFMGCAAAGGISYIGTQPSSAQLKAPQISRKVQQCEAVLS